MTERANYFSILDSVQRSCFRILGLDGYGAISFSEEFIKGCYGKYSDGSLDTEYVAALESSERGMSLLFGMRNENTDKILMFPQSFWQPVLVVEGRFGSLLEYIKSEGARPKDFVFMAFVADEAGLLELDEVVQAVDFKTAITLVHTWYGSGRYIGFH